MMHRRIALLAMLVVLAASAAPARGQGGDVQIVLDQFGVGGAWRPGSFVAVRLKVTALAASGLDRVTQAWVQWEVPNADGDLTEYGRSVALTKGQARDVWLYAVLPPNTLASSIWPARVYVFTDGQRGRELGGELITPPAAGQVDIAASMIGVVGRGQMGLNQLSLNIVGSSGAVMTAHEDTRSVGIRPADFCDRWFGLSSFEAIAWSGALPQDLSSAQSDALREWIRRGGHLIISLPEDTNPWGLGETGKIDLEDILPRRAPRKDEEVTVSELLPVLGKQRSIAARADFTLSIHVFEDLRQGAGAADNGYEPLIALPDGRVVAVQRLFGHGRITVVGIDLANPRLTRSLPLPNGELSGLPQADAFWNRVLGRRADTPSTGELRRIEADERLATGGPSEMDAGAGGGFRQEINMSGRAGAGLLMALVLFVLYWIVAGPGGFTVLKHYKFARHAWLAFAGAAAVFTALAWCGVYVLRVNEISARHLTFLDHIARDDGAADPVHDPQLQRATSYMSLYVPGYADTSIGIESVGGDASLPAQRDILVSWTPPRESSGAFPNIDRYVIDVEQGLDDYRIPSRSTATQLYAHWLGGVDPAWGGLLRSDPDDPIRVERDATGNEVLRGSIRNELPGDLEQVKMIWIRSRRMPPRRYAMTDGREEPWIARSGQMPNIGRMYGVGTIAQGASLPIPAPGPGTFLDLNIFETYVKEFETSGWSQASGSLGRDERRQRFEMLSLYQQLTPPKYLRPPGANSPDSMVARRFMGRELDLSPWFVRPCLIVIGYLEPSACPIPIRVNGKPVASTGTTVVRWIKPLKLDATIAFPRSPDRRAETGTDP